MASTNSRGTPEADRAPAVGAAADGPGDTSSLVADETIGRQAPRSSLVGVAAAAKAASRGRPRPTRCSAARNAWNIRAIGPGTCRPPFNSMGAWAAAATESHRRARRASVRQRSSARQSERSRSGATRSLAGWRRGRPRVGASTLAAEGCRLVVARVRADGRPSRSSIARARWRAASSSRATSSTVSAAAPMRRRRSRRPSVSRTADTALVMATWQTECQPSA